jgi:hypothetical protein
VDPAQVLAAQIQPVELRGEPLPRLVKGRRVDPVRIVLRAQHGQLAES